MARPSTYNFEIAEEICDRVSNGESIKHVLDSKDEYPTFPTWCKWRRENDELYELYYSSNPRLMQYRTRYENKGMYHVNGRFDRNFYERKRRAENHYINTKQRISGLIRDSFNRRTELSRKNETTSQILGCSIDFFCKYIERQFKDGINWDNRSEWHLDHIIPISSAKNVSELYKLNHYTNFQPLWAKDNMSKGDKILSPIQMKLTI
jgi:hypothetical protein